MNYIAGKTVCTIVTLANWKWFKDYEKGKLKKRGDDYDRIKDAIGQRVWEQTLTLFPQLEDKVRKSITCIGDKTNASTCEVTLNYYCCVKAMHSLNAMIFSEDL